VPEIEVRQLADVEQFLSRFQVEVSENGTGTSHEVTLSRADYERLGRAFPDPASLIRACFEFLLAREPKEQILSSFDVAQIGRFFPEFEREIGRLAPGDPSGPP